MMYESDDQKRFLDDVIEQAMEEYLKQFAEEDEDDNGNAGHESGPDIPGREEPERVRPENPQGPKHKDEHTK